MMHLIWPKKILACDTYSENINIFLPIVLLLPHSQILCSNYTQTTMKSTDIVTFDEESKKDRQYN